MNEKMKDLKAYQQLLKAYNKYVEACLKYMEAVPTAKDDGPGTLPPPPPPPPPGT